MGGQLDFTDECAGGIGPCEIGATFDRTLTWKIDQVPVDLTGATAKMHVRAKLSGPILIELSTENGRIVLGGVDGTVRLKLTASETAALDPVNGIYDLLINHGSEVEPLVKGKFQIVALITHD